MTSRSKICGARSLAYLGYDSECVKTPDHTDVHMNADGAHWFNLSNWSDFDEDEEY
mgnify:CR=1 FL=1